MSAPEAGPEAGIESPLPEPAAPPAGRHVTVWWLVPVLLVAAGLSAGSAYLAFKPKPASSVFASGRPSSTPTAQPSPTPTPTPSPSPTAITSFPRTGPGTYVYADGQTAVFGTAGNLRTYHVAVETGGPVNPDDFAAMVDTTLSDPRSWIAGKNVRLQRVAANTDANFLVVLVTAGTAQKLCNAVGLDIFWHGEPYTSCQAGQKAVINLTRWLTAVPDYGAPLYDYQQYAVNHEVGHLLGHDHELCPGKGMPAPVMQQQTFSLQGCVANSWPYLNGKRYSGPPGRIVPTD